MSLPRRANPRRNQRHPAGLGRRCGITAKVEEHKRDRRDFDAIEFVANWTPAPPAAVERLRTRVTVCRRLKVSDHPVRHRPRASSADRGHGVKVVRSVGLHLGSPTALTGRVDGFRPSPTLCTRLGGGSGRIKLSHCSPDSNQPGLRHEHRTRTTKVAPTRSYAPGSFLAPCQHAYRSHGRRTRTSSIPCVLA